MLIRVLLLNFIFLQVISGQKLTLDKVHFLYETPVIDGKLDDKLSYLKKEKFKHFFNFDNPVSDTIEVTYSMAYTPTHFYLYIETKSDSITHRDRGFINGDGFKLLLAKPQDDSLTDEYYDIVFSPSKDQNYWARKRIWDYNRKQNSGKKLSRNTTFSEACANGKCSFEVLLAWKDIEPYHPWFLEKMGCNLYFAKALENNTACGYAIIEDEGIWDEEVPKRNYASLDFEIPTSTNNEFIVAKPNRRNVKINEPLILSIISKANKNKTQTFEAIVSNDAGKEILQKQVKQSIQNHFSKSALKIDLDNLAPNHYNFILVSNRDTIAQYDFVVFPDFDFNAIRTTLLKNQHHLETGTVNTLMFKTNQIEQRLNSLKTYETGKEELDIYEKFKAEYDQFVSGKELYKGIRKNYRRAFLSKYDNTYQPYSIQLPADYDPHKQYPLLVFLHGSGQDEQGVLNQARSGGNFIELAPYARDMYRCYASEESQKDIIEAIEDVKRHFSVDNKKIIIGGFSMGGYGALRTFYEHPELYKGVAVFAGHPNLASDWLGSEQPNFLDEKYLKNFTKTPVFVYHGRKDGALPIAKAEELIAKLREKGIYVTERLIDNKSHEYPDDETNKIYFKWLNDILAK